MGSHVMLTENQPTAVVKKIGRSLAQGPSDHLAPPPALQGQLLRLCPIEDS